MSENVDYRALHRDLVSRLGFGDNITEPMADNDTIVAWFEEQGRQASEWVEHELWRGDCYAAGHPDDEDCDEHGPTCCNRRHLTPETTREMSESKQTGETAHIDWDAVARVETRIDNLYAVADRWARPGGSPRLAQRSRDKAEGMETALRLMGVAERPDCAARYDRASKWW